MESKLDERKPQKTTYSQSKTQFHSREATDQANPIAHSPLIRRKGFLSEIEGSNFRLVWNRGVILEYFGGRMLFW